MLVPVFRGTEGLCAVATAVLLAGKDASAAAASVELLQLGSEVLGGRRGALVSLAVHLKLLITFNESPLLGKAQ